MKIGIHNEPAGSSVGGSEQCVVLLAGELSQCHQVEIVHHRRVISREQLEAYCGVDLSRVNLRYVEPQPEVVSHSWLPWQHYKDHSRWNAALSAPYDVFVTFTHGVPPFCQAPKGVMVVLFPIKARLDKINAARPRHPLKKLMREFREWEWDKRMTSYQRKVSISRFTQEWTQRWWGVPSEVIYPPVDINFEVREKEKLILSVGRFTVGGHMKRQKETTGSFVQMTPLINQGWRYACVGAISDLPDEQNYLKDIQRVADGFPVQVEANIERDHLRALFERASIYWHAAGYGDDTVCRPQLTEHFGISTVEAMGAGCVPVVINKGAQPEIVEHGVSGFVWDTLDELQEYTSALAGDEALRAKMAAAARLRAQDFSREKFLKLFSDLLDREL